MNYVNAVCTKVLQWVSFQGAMYANINTHDSCVHTAVNKLRNTRQRLLHLKYPLKTGKYQISLSTIKNACSLGHTLCNLNTSY